jgi:hypothetical protein
MRQLPLFPPTVTLTDGRLHGPLPAGSPVIVSNGVGVDSIAMLIELRRLNIIPDAVVTALVGQGAYGNEHGRFYDYLPILENWLAAAAFPAPAYVWYEMKRTPRYFLYRSLAGNCLANRTLPSISFRRNHSCSLKYKGAEIDRWVTDRYGDTPCYRLIGYDLGEQYRATRFAAKPARVGPRRHDHFLYPLQLWGLTRPDCAAIIAAAGLPSPGLSSCFFCAAMRPEEVDALTAAELWVIVILEAHAQIKLKTIRGLWGHGERMTEYIVRRGLLPAALVAEVWAKWSAEERPPELRDNPTADADAVLFSEAAALAGRCG